MPYGKESIDNPQKAAKLAGLDWKVEQEPIYTETKELISGYKANVRNTDRSVLGVVTDRYKVIQNDEAFAFVDTLLGEGVRFDNIIRKQKRKPSVSRRFTVQHKIWRSQSVQNLKNRV